MMITGFEINESLDLQAVAPEVVVKACDIPDARAWLDLQDPSPSELESWLDKLGVNGLSRRICLEAGDRAGYYPLKNEICLTMPVLLDTGTRPASGYVTFLCRHNLLLTIHRETVWSAQQLAALDEAEDWLCERSIAALMSAMMIDLSHVSLSCVSQLKISTLALEDRLDRDPDSVEAEDILETRSELVTLTGVVNDQLPIVQALGITDRQFFKLKDAQDYMNCASVNLRAADGVLDRLDTRVDALRSGFQMHGQDKTNRRLGMLTILSAIFMPITLLAGIWGMNFETMPELKYNFSYPLALSSMAFIGASMYFFFRKGGWLN